MHTRGFTIFTLTTRKAVLTQLFPLLHLSCLPYANGTLCPPAPVGASHLSLVGGTGLTVKFGDPVLTRAEVAGRPALSVLTYSLPPTIRTVITSVAVLTPSSTSTILTPILYLSVLTQFGPVACNARSPNLAMLTDTGTPTLTTSVVHVSVLTDPAPPTLLAPSLQATVLTPTAGGLWTRVLLLPVRAQVTPTANQAALFPLPMFTKIRPTTLSAASLQLAMLTVLTSPTVNTEVGTAAVHTSTDSGLATRSPLSTPRRVSHP
mmetsp:Transcript_6358/g.12635  ORF Transcript_6358/g.12635 Transcript_6358/m.12635 type:complete len:263 (-) Transcript_6358:439-1227(-)